MAITFGDESGLLWTKQIYCGRSASKEPPSLKGTKLPDPVDYTPPEYRTILGRTAVSLDIETHDPNLETKGPGVYRKDGYILGVAIDYGDGDRRYYPVAGPGPNLDAGTFFKQLAQDAGEFDGTLVNANLQYDLDWLGSVNVHFEKATFFDVQYAEPLLNENLLVYNLESLGQRYLGVGKATSKLEAHYGPNFIKFLKDIHPYYVGEYACQDVYLPLEIMARQVFLMEGQGLIELCKMENALIPLMLQMRRTGVRVDLEAAQEAYDNCRQQVGVIAEQVKNLVGFPVEIYAAESIARAFEALGISFPKTKAGKPSFRKEWLASHPAPIAKLVMEQRKLEKISGTFLKGYILEGHANGRIHCMFHPLRGSDGGAVSGRYASSNPNLQNIPNRDKVLGPICRKIFLPEEGELWGRTDWSQIEFRFLVHYAVAARCKGAEIAANMYLNDPTTDFHSMAAEIASVERDPAKTVNFSIVYGSGKTSLAANLGRSVEEAEVILTEFHSRLPWLKQIFNMASKRASETGFITTILKRRRRFNMWERGYGETRDYITDVDYQALALKDRRGFKRAQVHKALNALLQGSAADLMKKSMLMAYNEGLFKILSPHVCVHDEMGVSVPRTPEGEAAFVKLVHIMEHTMPLNVPVITSAKTGENWYEAK